MVRVHKLISDDQDLEFTKDKKPILTFIVSLIFGVLVGFLAYIVTVYDKILVGNQLMFSIIIGLLVTVYYYYAEEVYSFFSYRFVKN